MKNISIIIKILTGVALLILSIKGIRWGNLMAGISSANPIWLALAISSVFMGLFCKLWRWGILVMNYQIKSSKTRLFSSYFIGQAANIILPFRGGDLVRIGYFTGEAKIIPEVASTVVLEKYLDLVALVVCGVLISAKISIDNLLNTRGWLLPITVIITLLLVLAVLYGDILWGKVKSTRKLPGSVNEWVDRWIEASRWLKNPRQIFPGILLTIFIWLVMWSTNMLVFKSLGIPLGGTSAGLVLISVYIGLLPALMPGNIGPFYFFTLVALLPFGTSRDLAFTYAVVLHATVTIPSLLCGATALLLRSERAVAA